MVPASSEIGEVIISLIVTIVFESIQFLVEVIYNVKW
jgi:hypothetical protein